VLSWLKSAQVNAFVISAAPVLKSVRVQRSHGESLSSLLIMAEQKENITINAVLPGVVPSQFIGQEMRETFGEDG
jgi:hypothetical protein